MMNTISATTSSRCISEPPTCPISPSSQSTSRITRIVHNIGVLLVVRNLQSLNLGTWGLGAMSMPVGAKTDDARLVAENWPIWQNIRLVSVDTDEVEQDSMH